MAELLGLPDYLYDERGELFFYLWVVFGELLGILDYLYDKLGELFTYRREDMHSYVNGFCCVGGHCLPFNDDEHVLHSTLAVGCGPRRCES